MSYPPTLAATAWHHGTVEPRPESVVDCVEEARRFGAEEHLPAPFESHALSPERPLGCLLGNVRAFVEAGP